jgi:hypothetical protein
MYIPQGSLVFGNIWAIMRDPGLYKDPEVFEPGRWLARDAIVGVEERKDVDVDVDREDEAGKERDPRTFVFEFGRRRDFDFGVALFGVSWHFVIQSLVQFSFHHHYSFSSIIIIFVTSHHPAIPSAQKLAPTHSRCPGTHFVEYSVWL